MYFIIETEEQLLKLPKVEKCFISLVSLSEESHPKLTTPCVLYYNDFTKGYVITIHHSEAFSIGIETIQKFLENIPKVYLLDSKWHSYYLNLPNAIDLYFTVLDIDNNLHDFQCLTGVHREFYNKFKYSTTVNTLVPLSKHYERCECMFEEVKPYIEKEKNLEWYASYVEAYKWVEEQGITINEKLFDKYFEPHWKGRSVKNSKIYTKYNLYNLTSRPTNAFNGINFLAFNKENHSRSALIPQNDIFIEFDFDGYHLRLIANMLNIKIPNNTSIHTVLGKQYFEKDELTPEEYQESKKITFRQLYNGVEREYMHIELFSKIVIFIDDLWDTMQYGGYIELPNGRTLKQGEFTPQKLFNYYIQCLETVNNVEKLLKLKKLLESKKSKVILVVYDSILLDFAKEDGRDLLEQVKNILEENNYVVKAQLGDNYDFSH